MTNMNEGEIDKLKQLNGWKSFEKWYNSKYFALPNFEFFSTPIQYFEKLPYEFQEGVFRKFLLDGEYKIDNMHLLTKFSVLVVLTDYLKNYLEK